MRSPGGSRREVKGFANKKKKAVGEKIWRRRGGISGREILESGMASTFRGGGRRCKGIKGETRKGKVMGFRIKKGGGSRRENRLPGGEAYEGG